MADLIAGTEFAKTVRSMSGQLTDCHLRQLVFKYCQLYQNVYSFGQLENAFAFIEIALTENRNAVESDLPSVRTEVEEAMGEYLESLNEVARAVFRLLDDRPMTTDDATTAIAHVWNAHACNEHPTEFRHREDGILCALLANAKVSQ